MRTFTQPETELYLLFFKSISLLKFNYEKFLIPIVSEIEKKHSSGGTIDINDAVSAMSAINSVIDALSRCLKVSRTLSGLNQKSDVFKKYIESQDWVTDARNKVQHINEQIKNHNTGPILGSLAWCNGEKHYIVSLNDHAPGREIPGLVIDTHTGKAVMDMAYIYNEKYLNIHKAYFGS